LQKICIGLPLFLVIGCNLTERFGKANSNQNSGAPTTQPTVSATPPNSPIVEKAAAEDFKTQRNLLAFGAGALNR
jgi:hypothetical protein